MARGFDNIASYYDFLARLVFGESIRRCQLEYLDKVPPGSKVLILGGGTGWLLEELLKVNPSSAVWYVESSAKMIEKARSRVAGESKQQTCFIQGTEKSLEQFPDLKFDVVISNFYLDVFTSSSLNEALNEIGKRLRPGTLLLVSEFVDHRRWMRLMLLVMYTFFRLVGAIETRSLPDWQDQLINSGFVERSTTAFYGGFIQSSLYLLEKNDGNSSRH